MRPTDFSKSLTDFLTCYLPGEKGASKNTIASYKDTFILFLTFMKDEKGILADKVMLKHVNKEIVVDFLDWIEEKLYLSTQNSPI